MKQDTLAEVTGKFVLVGREYCRVSEDLVAKMHDIVVAIGCETPGLNDAIQALQDMADRNIADAFLEMLRDTNWGKLAKEYVERTDLLLLFSSKGDSN